MSDSAESVFKFLAKRINKKSGLGLITYISVALPEEYINHSVQYYKKQFGNIKISDDHSSTVLYDYVVYMSFKKGDYFINISLDNGINDKEETNPIIKIEVNNNNSDGNLTYPEHWHNICSITENVINNIDDLLFKKEVNF